MYDRTHDIIAVSVQQAHMYVGKRVMYIGISIVQSLCVCVCVCVCVMNVNQQARACSICSDTLLVILLTPIYFRNIHNHTYVSTHNMYHSMSHTYVENIIL